MCVFVAQKTFRFINIQYPRKFTELSYEFCPPFFFLILS